MSSVKFFHSAMTNAPVLSGVAGALIGVLDACLVNGFDTRSVDSIVVAGGVATVSISAGHLYEVDAIVKVAGSTPAELNGDKRVLSVTVNSLTFDATDIADQTATGTITVKYAPAGWAKVYSGTNVAAYRSPDVTGTRLYLRVDDTGAQNARVVGYEAMTDVNTGTGPFPTAAQVSGGLYWPKANSTATTARAWTVIATAKTVYLHTNTHVTTASLGAAGFVMGFGDFASQKSGDAYGAFLSGATSDVAASTSTQTTCLGYGTAATGTNPFYVPRSYTAIGSALACSNVVESFQGTAGHSGTVANIAAYPNGPDNALILSRKLLVEPTGPHLRGVIPGLLHVSQNAAASFAWRDKVNGQGSYAGRKLYAVKGAAPAGTTATVSLMFFDITGPW